MGTLVLSKVPFMLSIIIPVYLIGLGLVWLFTAEAVSSEPTAHGQSILLPLGCSVGLLWPVVLVYMILVSPLALYTYLSDHRAN